MRRLEQIGRPRSPLRRGLLDQAFRRLGQVALWGGLAALAALFLGLAWNGLPSLGLDFLASGPSRDPGRAGIGPALLGSLWVCLLATVLAVPPAVATALLLQETESRHLPLRRLQDFVRVNLAGLANTPPVVVGILGVVVFAQMGGLRLDAAPVDLFDGTPLHLTLPFGRSVFAGGATMALVMLPLVIQGAQRALAEVPDELREDALALGASPLQLMGSVTLPVAMPRILAAVLLAMARAIGEAAPLLAVAGLAWISSAPRSLADDFTVLPLQIFEWARRPEPAFRELAWAGALVLVAIQLGLSAVAALLYRCRPALGGSAFGGAALRGRR